MNKTLHPDLFPETLLCDLEDGQIFTTSLKVAEHFGKRHKNVLQAIDQLLSDLDEQLLLKSKEQLVASDDDAGLKSQPSISYFYPSTYQVFGGKKTVRQEKYYQITHDGFALLAMGFK